MKLINDETLAVGLPCTAGPFDPNEEALAMGKAFPPLGEEGRYVYGLALFSEGAPFHPAGIDGKPVRLIVSGALCAIVHDCLPQPYRSAEADSVRTWVMDHHRVLDEASKMFDCVVPVSFDTIVCAQGELSSDNVVQKWLQEEQEALIHLMCRFRNKNEYVVQLFCAIDILENKVAFENKYLLKLKQDIDLKSPGLAYMYKQKLDKAIKDEVSNVINKFYDYFYDKVSSYCSEIIVEKPKKSDNSSVAMISNLSCMVDGNKIDDLGKFLDEIKLHDSFSVRFTGPWPLYSFVGDISGIPRNVNPNFVE